LKHALIGLPQIGDMAAAVACFQNRDAALHPKALLLSEQARAQIIEKNEVGSKLPCEKDGTDFSEAQEIRHPAAVEEIRLRRPAPAITTSA
jgi:hypothetical protein